MNVITLLTDFGTADGYVAEMKGVLVSNAPSATLIDLSHEVPAQDVAFARLTVARYWRRFPVGTVHLVVVDPGVGTAREAIAVESEGRFLVGPDNGVLSPALFSLSARVVSVPVPITASPTFHGRDVFAPAAAALAQGTSLDELGDVFHSPVRLRTPQPRRDGDGSLHGEVLTIDRFGNVMTNLVVRDAGGVVVAGARTARLVRTYGEAASGELVALVGSSGFVELAVRDGNAALTFGLSRGHAVSRPAG
ncbi:MAG TPA: SAM-dependent chlorinase/fluorinase [Gemmatimonas sp.]|uniref:SAM hydrolase/SAM-dependent halogenase family protein n=1 Tax=Gemmatimonas sp. TaxID=1962908 RepID=UPI002ED952E2